VGRSGTSREAQNAIVLNVDRDGTRAVGPDVLVPFYRIDAYTNEVVEQIVMFVGTCQLVIAALLERDVKAKQAQALEIQSFEIGLRIAS
jgi:hypothetical protein